MAKIFQLGLFLNFVVVGMGIGALRVTMNNKRILTMFGVYFIIYLFIGLTFLSDTAFLVPEP
jgi:hypothetical protein